MTNIISTEIVSCDGQEKVKMSVETDGLSTIFDIMKLVALKFGFELTIKQLDKKGGGD